jgi:hypothetical protein
MDDNRGAVQGENMRLAASGIERYVPGLVDDGR